MNTHTFLSFIQNNYDFTRANSIVSELNLNHCWKNWLTAELVHLFNSDKDFEDIETNKRYQNETSLNNVSTFIRYREGKPIEDVQKKQLASYCDFSFSQENKRHYFEIRCANKSLFSKNNEVHKYKKDIMRIESIKKHNPNLNIHSIFAFYGMFNNEEINKFSSLDNSKRCTYILDSNLKGSTSISRLSQMQRSGLPRICLAVYNAT